MLLQFTIFFNKSVANRLFSKYNNKDKLESDNTNQNQTLTIDNFFITFDQKFIQ